MLWDFHEKFDCARATTPGFPDDETAALRGSLVAEEAEELADAVQQRDLIAVADALADLVYVAVGTAVTFGIDLRPIFAEVHRSNMAKTGGGKREDGKILKPPGWTPPDIAGKIGERWDKAKLAGRQA